MMQSKFQELVSKAQFAMCVFSNPDATDVALVGFESGDEALQELQARGVSRLVGVVGIADGQACSEFDVPLDGPVIDAISAAFVQAFEIRYHDAIEVEKARLGSLAWLEDLHALPDTRQN
ncbi:MAG TPA: hypothetical protein VGN01_01360 [Acidobacteriaceae bacterium]|jgi:hypothetical protein